MSAINGPDPVWGQAPPPRGIGERLKALGRKVKEYAEPRPSTTGDTFAPSAVSGAL